MLRIERDIEYDMLEENIERSQQDILNQDNEEQLIEKSDLTAMGVTVPEMLVTEEDQQQQDLDDNLANRAAMIKTHKTNSLYEFMDIESQIEQATDEKPQVLVGNSFTTDELANTVGTELTEVL